jgi:hypothetical protein
MALTAALIKAFGEMAGYQPLKISGMTAGLVQEREEFLLPEDAYPTLQNAFVWRERLKRKQGNINIVQGNPASSILSRALTTASFTTIASGGGPFPKTFSFSVITQLIAAGSITAGEVNASFPPGSATNMISIVIGGQTLTDSAGTGTLTIVGAGNITAATLSYSSGMLNLTVSGVLGATVSTFTGNYYPQLPVMGLRTEELQNSAFDQTIAFDQVYAYLYNAILNIWEEFLPGTTWTGNNAQFMWTTNYFVGTGNFKIFWATNNNDPIRYTNGVPSTNWVNFAPIINASGGTLTNALVLLPFRGRLVAFNVTQAGSSGGIFTNRIRWAAIGTPFTTVSPIVSSVNANAWRDDIRGQGGFLDIPTSEDIVAVGFVRDNCVIYCERSTWQLRYTGRTIAPFQIERVNSELGAESTFSAVQFDTSLVGIGDKGIVECDSYKSERIDIKIPDIVFNFSNSNTGTARVHGIRDFISRLAYWTFPSSSYETDDESGTEIDPIFPDKRLVYNYENDSWAIFDDSFTCFGTFQTANEITWLDIDDPWVDCDFTWVNEPEGDPVVVAGNQQGFVMELSNQLQATVTNDASLTITAITANTTTPTVITSPNHNLQTGAVIQINGIITGTPFDNLNGGVFGIIVDPNNGANTFQLMNYDPTTQQFSDPQLDVPTTPYIGTGFITVRDNFNITSKKFNFLDEGQSVQMGFVDILMAATPAGAISMNVYQDYEDSETTNTLPQNIQQTTSLPDTFFNATIPTTQSITSGVGGTKFWQRVYCATRANFLTIQYTFSNAQMAGDEQTQDVQIDAQILWQRRGGRLTQP